MNWVLLLIFRVTKGSSLLFLPILVEHKMDRNHQWRCPVPGEWVRGKLVGSGSFGTIHMALAKSTGRLFVVKSAQSGIGVQALENEADILESLNSPHIVHCIGKEFSIDKNGEQQNYNVFLEYMAGGNLLDVVHIFGGSLDEQVIRLYTKEILLGLKYLHDNGIVHCDLKCKNVLLSSSGNVKLADFGSAKRMTKKTTDDEGFVDSWQNIVGTPLWMAPEVLRKKELDLASDIWSLGCTVIEMATGNPPWDVEITSNPMAAILKIACGNDKPQFPTKFSQVGLDFLAKCLERDPRKRWKAEELLNHPFVSGENSSLRKSSREEVELVSFSPASVLDINVNGILLYGEGSDSDQEAETKTEAEDSRLINPFARRCHEGNWMAARQQRDNHFDSSENWITVR
ncbi:mitogen-activated protein kinase kinase kinase 18 [Ziziphus jujuba]|uniref:Mitogen-activated protein kinase kinase kinase 18 n=1 Tax=Ziziphus jujuba TaxID=326968 RepID=A0A6P4BE73_ZIZJJ|nr:mitogen-activated protein kinase kinase kinase 18 [Ziziphus jujuba]